MNRALTHCLPWIACLGLACLAPRRTPADGEASHPSRSTGATSSSEPGERPGARPRDDEPGEERRPEGHVFVPRERPPHLPPTAKRVPLDQLPPLRVALGQCFEGERPRPVSPVPRPRPRPRKMKEPSRARSAGPPSTAAAGVGSGAPGLAQKAPGGGERRSGARARQAASAAPRAEAADRALETAAPAPAGEPRESLQAASPSGYHDWGAAVYLSNDDSMSLSSAQRVIYAIDRFLPIPPEHVRPHELLNYFSFDTAPVDLQSDFSVHAELEPKPGEEGIYTLGLSVAGRDRSRAERRNAALTFVIDRSGSMRDEGRMEYLKRGLSRMIDELKEGDLVNLVLFDDRVCTPVENFVPGRDPLQVLEKAVRLLVPRGATNLHAGLSRGYDLANRSYQPSHSNRVVLITDALTNTGVTNERAIALIGENYDRRRIRLSGVGVGSQFNDTLLDRLTERGHGAYVFLGSGAEVDAVFGSRFTSLIETVANDVHFRLHLPPSLAMNVFYGEESSTRKEDVLPIHYFAGTSQLFLSDLRARGGELNREDGLMLGIEYENAETGQPQVEEYAFRLGDIGGPSRNVRKARLVMSFIDGVSDTLESQPRESTRRAGGWVDDRAWQQCERGKESLANQARALPDDREVTRVVKLWNAYCSRYRPSPRAIEPPREPVRRVRPRGGDVWPSARE